MDGEDLPDHPPGRSGIIKVDTIRNLPQISESCLGLYGGCGDSLELEGSQCAMRMRRSEFRPYPWQFLDSHPVESLEELSVKRTKLDGLQHLVAGDVFLSGKIGEGSGNFEDAVVGAGGKVHLFHGVFEVAFAFGIELAAIADLARRRRVPGSLRMILR